MSVVVVYNLERVAHVAGNGSRDMFETVFSLFIKSYTAMYRVLGNAMSRRMYKDWVKK
jgi:hypothetical protein